MGSWIGVSNRSIHLDNDGFDFLLELGGYLTLEDGITLIEQEMGT